MNNDQTLKSLLNQWLIDIFVDFKDRKMKRIDTRRVWPLLVIVLIVSVTITHEATYAGSFESDGYQFIGWPYALAINLAIIIGEYFIQWKSARIAAWATFIIATVGSGALNIAYVRPWEYSGFDALFAWVYALLPTVIIVCLGLLASRVAKIARTQEARWEREDEDTKANYECFCGESFAKSIQLAGHSKKHIAELKQQPNIETGVNALVYFKQTYPNSTFYPPIDQLNNWANDKK
jgi:hypothetical protein